MNKNSTIIDSRSEGKKRKGSFIYLIFAALCSVVLWLYVAGVDTDMAEKKFTSVSINLENAQILQENLGYSVLSGYNLTADITVSGRKADISRLKASDVVIWADLSSVTEAGENKLTVQADLPDGMTVTSCYPQSITVYADETTSRAVPVEVRVVSMTKGGDLEISEPALSQQTVNVSGPARLLDSVASATVSLDLGNVTSSFEITGSVVLLDESGARVDSPYIRSDVTEVTAAYTVYKTKKVPVSVGFANGFLTNSDVAVSISPSSLQVKGEPQLIDSLTALEVYTYDESQLTEADTQSFISAEALKLPDGVTLDDMAAIAEGITVNVRLVNSSRGVQIPLVEENVTVLPPQGLDYSFNQDILTVDFRGSAAALSRLSPENVKLSVDLSGFASEGIKTNVPVRVEFQSGREAYVVGEYFLSVTLFPSEGGE